MTADDWIRVFDHALTVTVWAVALLWAWGVFDRRGSK